MSAVHAYAYRWYNRLSVTHVDKSSTDEFTTYKQTKFWFLLPNSRKLAEMPNSGLLVCRYGSEPRSEFRPNRDTDSDPVSDLHPDSNRMHDAFPAIAERLVNDGYYIFFGKMASVLSRCRLVSVIGKQVNVDFTHCRWTVWNCGGLSL